MVIDQDKNDKITLSFLVTFWGDLYTFYTINYCLASLISGENCKYIVSVQDKITFEFVVCCLEEDWEVFVQSKIYRIAKEYITFVFIKYPHEKNKLEINDSMVSMSAGHSELALYCLKNNKFGSVLYPECVVSNEFIGLVCSYLVSDIKFSFVNYLSVRMCDERIFQKIRRFRDKNHIISIDTYTLVLLGQQCRHPEMVRSQLSIPYEADGAGCYFFDVRSKDTTVFYTLHWAPILINYPALRATHNLDSLRNWTLDGDYIYKNSSKEFPVRTVKDNCRGAILGFTDTRFSPFPLFVEVKKDINIPLLALCYKAAKINFRLSLPDLDEHKRKCFFEPIILFHKEPKLVRKNFIRIYSILYIRIIWLLRFLRISGKCIKGKIEIASRENKKIIIHCPFHSFLAISNLLERKISAVYKRIFAKITRNRQPKISSKDILYIARLIIHSISASCPDELLQTNYIKEGYVEFNVNNADAFINFPEAFEIGVFSGAVHPETEISKIRKSSVSINSSGVINSFGNRKVKVSAIRSKDKIGILIHRGQYRFLINGKDIFQQSWQIVQAKDSRITNNDFFTIFVKLRQNKFGSVMCQATIDMDKYLELTNTKEDRQPGFITLERLRWEHIML